MDALLRFSQKNLAEALRHFSMHAPGAILHERRGVLCIASSHPHPGPFHNAAMRSDPNSGAEEVLSEAREFFGELRRRFALWVEDSRDTDLADLARREHLSLLEPREGSPGMVRTRPLAPPPEVPDRQIREVRTTADAEQFAEVVAASFSTIGMPPEAARAIFSSPDVLLKDGVRAFLASFDLRPVACAMTLMTGEVAGVYWVGTLDEVRRHGFGEAVTRVATGAVFKLGVEAVVLQATTLGEPLYRRLGFREITRYRRFLG